MSKLYLNLFTKNNDRVQIFCPICKNDTFEQDYDDGDYSKQTIYCGNCGYMLNFESDTVHDMFSWSSL